MKLELKHIAPYLSYGLKIDASYYDEEEPLTISYVDENLNGIHLCGQSVGAFAIPVKQEYDLDKAKPILRPLIEYKKYEEILDEFSEHSEEQFETAFFILQSDNKFDFVNYTIMELMFKFHLDIFQLIPKGLAIDINTLNK